LKDGDQLIASAGPVEGRTVVTLYLLPATVCANCGQEIDENTMTICSKCLNEPDTACTKNHTHGKGCMQ